MSDLSVQPLAPRDAVRDATAASFREDVLTASLRQAVLVVFWAPSDTRSRAYAQSFDALAKAAAGKAAIVRLDVNKDPEIAQQLGVQAVPAAIAFQRGQPMDGFSGPLPDAQVRGFLERLVGPLTAPEDDLVEAARAALEAGDRAGAVDAFTAALELNGAQRDAIAGLARLLAEDGRIEDAQAVLATASPEALAHPVIAAAAAAVALAGQAGALGDQAGLERRVAADPADHEARFDLALGLNAQNQRDDAASQLLEIIKRDRTWNEDGARKQLVQFFEVWGPMDPATKTARRKLSTLLFS